ncbi:heat-inducible transcriptional repressor HrcA [bacterium]|nr:heat-inducible transcriptional repressor HrcA [bacterium]
MDQRTEDILEKIIVHYIENAEPIGSRVLSKIIDQSLSPATIRNVMSDLTDMGFIEQPHTSAGRLPTDLGYRYYINKLLNSKKRYTRVPYQIKIINFEGNQHSRLEDILLDATAELSSMTNCTGVVISPNLSTSRLKQLQLIKLSTKQILVVIITQIGMVHNKVIHVRSCPSQDDLNKMSAIIVDLFEREPIAEIRESLVKRLTKISDEENKLIVQTIRLGKKAFDIETPGELYITCRSKMCSFPEFSNQDKLKAVYKAFEEKTALTDIMIRAMDNEGIKINIGTENHHQGLDTCSIIAGTYGSKGYLLGSMGIVGPTRLNYPKVISAIHYSTQKLSFSLSRFLENS